MNDLVYTIVGCILVCVPVGKYIYRDLTKKPVTEIVKTLDAKGNLVSVIYYYHDDQIERK